MAVAVVTECKGATLDQYDQVLAKMGRTPRGRGAPGSLFHWVTATEDGIRVTDGCGGGRSRGHCGPRRAGRQAQRHRRQ
jgi:hypothetical protein